MTTTASATTNANVQPFLEARDFLLRHRLDYDTAYRDFRWPQLKEFNWALDHFDTMALGNEATALHIVEDGADGPDGETRRETKRSFQQLSTRSSQVANFLRQHGVQRGDRVLLMLGNELALWELMLGIIKLGAVLIPATSLLTADDLVDRIERGQVKHIVTGSEHTGKFGTLGALVEGCTRIAVGAAVDGWVDYARSADAPEAFTPDAATLATDPLLLYFTSGTTSKPKLVLHSHQSYPVGHLSTMFWIGLQPGDVHLNISSPGWAKHAWSCFFAPWNAGACIFLYNYTRFNAQRMLGVLASNRVTSLCAPPTVWRMLIQEDLAAHRDKLRLRELVGAGEPLNPEIIEQVRNAWGLTLRDGFGQTETSAQIGNPPNQPMKPGSMGRPLPGFRVTLLDSEGQPAPEGEICLQLDPAPLGLMLGYMGADGKDEVKNDEAMRFGHYHTGDTAAIDDQGFITFVGRADDVFKSSDYRISPFELESALIEHDDITEVAVVPSPDPLRLSVPKAYLLLRAGVTPDAALAAKIFAFSRAQLAPYKRVRRIEFVTELPKTISGKIRRVQLRAREIELRAANQRAPGEFFEDDSKA